MSVNIEKYLRNIHTPNGRIYPHLDCWGLVCYVYKNELNIELDLCTDCQKDTMTDGYEKIKGSFTEVKTPRDFDVICYFKHSVLVHVGIYIYTFTVTFCIQTAKRAVVLSLLNQTLA